MKINKFVKGRLYQIEISNSPIGRIDISYLVIPMIKIKSTNE